MTIFEQIIQGKVPADRVFEDDKIIVIKDIHPQAPVHLLLIPKKPVKNLQALEPEDISIVEAIVRIAQRLAKEFGIEKGYRLVTNNGKSAGQTVFHLHFHLLGGAPLGCLA